MTGYTGFKPLPTVCSLASALAATVALGLSCRTVFNLASLAFSVLPFLGHSLLQKEKAPRKGAFGTNRFELLLGTARQRCFFPANYRLPCQEPGVLALAGLLLFWNLQNAR